MATDREEATAVVQSEPCRCSASSSERLNVNDVVRVKLTAEGRKIHAKAHVDFWATVGQQKKYTPPKEDAEGWSEWQLWSLMDAFGKHLGMGLPLPFETEIVINF